MLPSFLSGVDDMRFTCPAESKMISNVGQSFLCPLLIILLI